MIGTPDARSSRGGAVTVTLSDRRTAVVLFLGCLFFVVLVRTAWLGDDAYITFRTVDNFVSGYGMRWNVAERVQSFTHPLWFLVFTIPYYFTREAFFTAYAVEIALSMIAYVLLLRRVAATAATAWLVGTALLFSKSFMDYSTSGLENPLSHVLILLFLLTLWRVRDTGEGLARLWLLGGLLVLNRLDLLLLLAPAMVVASWPFRWKRWMSAAAVGLLPLIAWEVFAIIYYGFPFPNTAYAKLQTGVPTWTLIGQGLLYVVDAFSSDPVTPLTVLLAVALIVKFGPRRDWPILIGLILYLGYIIRVGGDFMTGRFLSVPLLAVVAVWARVPWRLPRGAMAATIGAIAVLGIFGTTRPPITSGAGTFILNPNDGISNSGVADERAFYYRYTGLLRWSRARTLPWNAQVERGLALKESPGVVQEVNVGFMGYYAGPAVTIIDGYGLGDPLLSRLPAQADWRIGHYYRPSPPGYLESVRDDRNLIADPDLALLYEQIRTITRGPIWSKRRWRAILALNLR
jgi:arabinofuranosyltransferase